MRILIAFLGMLLISCGPEITGGTSTETTNGTPIVSTQGEPVINAMALIINNSDWFGNVNDGVNPVIDTLYSDSSGIIHFYDLNDTFQTIQVQHKNEVAIVKEDVDTIVLKKGKKLSGYAPGSERIYIGGTALSTTTQTNDSFYIENVPEGAYSLFGRADRFLPMISRTQVDSINQIYVKNTNDTSVLIDDFLGGFTGNPLAAVTGAFYWYTFSDYEAGSYSKNGWKFVVKDDARGKSTVTPSASEGMVKFTIFLSDSGPSPYGGVGTILYADSTRRGYDLKGMSGVRIKIRGTGTVLLSLKTEKIDSLNALEGMPNISPYHVKLPLTEVMIDTTIQISDFHLNPEDSLHELQIPLVEGIQEVKKMQINYRERENLADSTYWFEVDEVWFNGVELPF